MENNREASIESTTSTVDNNDEVEKLSAASKIADDHPLSTQINHLNGSDCENPVKNSSDGHQTSTSNKNSQETRRQSIPKESNFLYKATGKLLGIRFLNNERNGFEQEVERSMHQLVQKNLMLSVDDSQQECLSPPIIHINIPKNIKDFVLIQIETNNQNGDNNGSSMVEEDRLFDHIKKCNEQFFSQIPDENYVRSHLLQHPIRILVNQLFLYRGQLNTPVERCLAMTTVFVSNRLQQNNRYQQCLVVSFESPAMVTEVLNVFRKLHGIPDISTVRPSIQHMSNVNYVNENKVVINAEVEIQEELTEGKWETCPWVKDSFKLRTNLEKKIIINLSQDLTHHSYPLMRIERCFGMLLSSGRNVSSDQMVAIGLDSMSSSIPNPETAPNQQQWQIVANWIPLELDSDHLNTETPRNSRIYFTIALDLILENVEEPIRFVFEAKAKIIPSSQSTTEKLWKNFTNLSKQSQRFMQECFSLIVQQHSVDEQGIPMFKVVSCLSSAQIAMHKQRLSMQLNLNKIADSSQNNYNGQSATPGSPVPEESFEPENDEPLQSGSGLVNKECSQNELKAWQNIMEKWNKSENHSVRPKLLTSYVRRGGIPQALRPEVWQLLSRAHEIEGKILPKYKLLVTQESPHESIIMRDILRTFTAHEKFRETSTGSEQESLFRICKAYSNYDAEIGYCQGLSYLVAALLLNMPEEQAFCVLVQIMYRYGLRDLFKSGLENLHCKFYQLERLLDEQIPELFSHFMDLKIEAHMYASQWFLTLFTTKFPLNVVFMIIDLFLLDEMDVILQIGLGLLGMSKNDLLALDFEGIMKYFRVTLPKLYRNDDVAKELIHRSIKINVKRAKKYELQYKEWREKNRDPLEILQTENKRLMQTVARLEQENDDLTQELLGVCQSKIRMQKEVDRAEDKAETLNTTLLQTRTHLVDSEEDRKQLTEELRNLKVMCRKEIDRYEAEKQNDRKIIEEYKQICTNYQEKFETEQKNSAEKITKLLELIKSCAQCSEQAQKVLTEYSNDENDQQKPLILDPAKQDQYEKIADLEAELIKTKIALAESEDRNGQLIGKLHITNSELNILKAQNDERAAMQQNTWFSKTFSSLRDAATIGNISNSVKPVKLSSSISSGMSINESNSTNHQEDQHHHHHNNNQQQQQHQQLNKLRRESSQSDH